MRFMVIVNSDAKSEAGILPDEELLSTMGKYNDELVKAGVMLAGEGLHASSKGSRVRMSGGKFKVVDGPFAETKELVAGFWIMQAASRQEVLDWVKRAPGHEGELEVRPLYGPEDFPVDPAEQPGGWRDQEQAMRDKAEAAGPAGGITPRKPGTTRYMLLLKADAHSEAGAPPDRKVMDAMGALMDEVVKSGAMLGGEGLKPSSQSARVRFAGTQRTVIDGPFTETKELVAGYLIVQTKTRAEAEEIARRWLQVHADTGYGSDGEIEVRQVAELEDFPVDPAEKPDGWRQHEQAFRDRQGR